MNKTRLMQFTIVALVMCVTVSYAKQEGQPLRFGVSASVEATDNRDATESNKESNVDVFLRPYVAFHIDREVTSLHFRYEPGLRYRTEPGDDQNEFDLHHRLTLSLRQALNPRARVRASNTFLKIDDPQIAEGGAVLRADRSYILNTARAALNYDLGELSNLDLTVHNQIRRYDDSQIAILTDKNEIGVGVDFRHTLTPTIRALANAHYDSYSFKSDGLRSRDFDSITGTLGLEYVFTPQIIGSFSGGMQTRSYDDAAFETDDNIHVVAELSGTITPDLRVGGTAGFGVRDSDVYPYPSQEYTEVRGYANMNVSPAITLRGALTYRASTYDAYPQLGLGGGDEDLIVADAQLTYRLTELASLLAGHRYEDISADDGLRSGSFTRNTTRLGVRLDF